MSATINLLPRKEFEITLEDGTVIKGQFGTWALKRFCDKINCELEDIGERFKKPKIGDIFEFLLAAVEYRARLKGDPFSYNDVHAGDWIDQLGGPEAPEFARLFNHAADGAKEEKKTLQTETA